MFKHRIRSIQKTLTSKRISALWVAHSVNVRYLSGFHMPEDAKLLITSKNAYLFTDFRYQNERDNFPDFEMVIWGGSAKPTETVSGVLKKERVKKLGFESAAVTVFQMQHFLKKLKATLVPTERFIEELRSIKDNDELKYIKKACAITDEAFRSACTFLRPGKTEKEVAWHIEMYMRTHGAEALAFDCIIASGPNGDKPHAAPSKRKIQAGDLVTIDIGARVNGYHSDMTRTVAVGFAPDDLKPMYEIVRRAQEAALKAVRDGVVASKIDSTARQVIAKEGYSDFFGHATGHGVGLEIHEAPSVSHLNQTKLREGMIITVEPGIYIPSQGGVRIEDTVLVTKKGYKVLSHSPKVLCIV